LIVKVPLAGRLIIEAQRKAIATASPLHNLSREEMGLSGFAENACWT
jgi:hypothetical protein